MKPADLAGDEAFKLERLLVSMENWFRSNSGKAAGGGGGVGAYGASPLGGGGNVALGPGGQALGPGGGAGGGGGPAGAGGSGPHSRTSSAGGSGGGGSGSFLDAVANIETGNKNIMQSPGTKDVNNNFGRGGGDPSQGYFQIINATWRRYAGKAGVDLNK
jgi:hypothetical protein